MEGHIYRVNDKRNEMHQNADSSYPFIIVRLLDLIFVLHPFHVHTLDHDHRLERQSMKTLEFV